jgi:hypothetical protein
LAAIILSQGARHEKFWAFYFYIGSHGAMPVNIVKLVFVKLQVPNHRAIAVLIK